jgi:type II secretory pathway pseudopilin PulG
MARRMRSCRAVFKIPNGQDVGCVPRTIPPHSLKTVRRTHPTPLYRVEIGNRAYKQGVKGFTYLGLLIFIAVIGLASTAGVSVGTLVQRRSAEQDLLFIGSQFRNAFQSYYTATPAGQRPYPNTLEELVKDPRFPQPVRHLRKVYADPITGKIDWVLIAAPMGGTMGISSKSEAQPIKIGNFDEADKMLEGKSKYSEWVFFYNPAGIANPRKN